jgi:hypothetical protein
MKCEKCGKTLEQYERFHTVTSYVQYPHKTERRDYTTCRHCFEVHIEETTGFPNGMTDGHRKQYCDMGGEATFLEYNKCNLGYVEQLRNSKHMLIRMYLEN